MVCFLLFFCISTRFSCSFPRGNYTFFTKEASTFVNRAGVLVWKPSKNQPDCFSPALPLKNFVPKKVFLRILFTCAFVESKSCRKFCNQFQTYLSINWKLHVYQFHCIFPNYSIVNLLVFIYESTHFYKSRLNQWSETLQKTFSVLFKKPNIAHFGSHSLSIFVAS